MELRNRINLKAYMEKAKRDLDDFETKWQKGQLEKPKLFPATLSLDDWDKQLIEYLHAQAGMESN